MKLALAIIAKDEREQLSRIIADYGHYFDEICIAVDDEEVCDYLVRRASLPENSNDSKLKVFRYQWQDDFSHKRNFLAENVESEYYFRMDTDDDIVNPENIKKIFDKTIKTDADCIYVPYIYGKDEDGNCIAKHWRETIIKKREGVHWKKRIHENIFVEDQDTFKGAKDDSISILHKQEPGHAERS